MPCVLTQEQKTFIVQQLAMYSTPQEVAHLVKETFGIDVSRQMVSHYNADTSMQLADYWRKIFAKTRAEFMETVAKVPAANQAYRLRTLQKLIDNQLNNGRQVNSVLVQSLLEQAAKEVGGVFTNRREMTGKDARPIIHAAEMAKRVFNDIMASEDADRETATQFVTERYGVPEDVLVSEAEN